MSESGTNPPGPAPPPGPALPSQPAIGAQQMGPLTAYRVARGWDLGAVVDCFNDAASLPGTDSSPGPRLPLTAEGLHRYEVWPAADGSEPSEFTLGLLAQIYQTDPQNLIDRRDHGQPPPSTGAVPGASQSGNDPASTIFGNLIGQATAVIAVLAAVVYTAGGLTLGLKLWFFQLSWTPILGQLPRDFILITAVGQVILPCLAVGAVVGFGLYKLFKSSKGAAFTKGKWYFFGLRALLVAAAAGAWLGVAPLFVLFFTRHSASLSKQQPVGLLQPPLDIFLFCSVTSAVTVFVALCVIRLVYKPERATNPVRLALVMALMSVAFIPGVAAVSAAYLLPPVVLCAPNFLHPVNGKPAAGEMRGNLIGSNSQWAYIAQFTFNGNTVVDRTITAVPTSAIRLEGIGVDSGCGDLTTSTR
jgi:hypothetical protein